jgi:PAS domain S-box-containing protein
VHACEIGERVCAAVREAGRSAGARVTLSVGVATSPHDGRTGSELIDVADGALYRAKLAGGDRVAFRAGLWSIEARSTRARPRRATGRRSPASEEHRLRARVDQLTALYQTAVSLLDSLDPDQLIREILERAGELLATPHGYLYLVTPDRSALELRLGLGEFERHVGLRLAPGEGVAGSVWASGEPLNVDDYSAWAGRSPQFPGPFRATVGAPLTSRGEVIGVLGLAYLRQGRTFDDDQVALLSRFAQLASVALRNARLYDEANRELASARHEEEQARRSEALFRALAEHSTELIGIIDADGRPRFVSPSNLRVLGYTPEELRQADPFALPHPDDVAAVREAFGRVVSRPGSSITLRYRLRHKDGRWLHVEGTATNLLHDDIVRGIVVNSRILHDHERKPSGQAREGRLDCRPRSRTGTSNRAKRAPASRDGASRRQGSAANGPARPAEAPR